MPLNPPPIWLPAMVIIGLESVERDILQICMIMRTGRGSWWKCRLPGYYHGDFGPRDLDVTGGAGKSLV